MKPYISVVVATFNSANTLAATLQSIVGQTYPHKNIEILIVDGGSKDKTLAIAKKFSCTIIKNKKVEPLYAKYLGYIHANGKYILYVDHDEVMANPNSLKLKIKIFKENPQVKAIATSGYISPPGYKAINKYINEFGDPFSFFIYRLSKNPKFFLHDMKKSFRSMKSTSSYEIFDLSSSASVPLIELVAGGAMVDGSFLKKTFPEIKTNYSLIPHFLHLIRNVYPLIAITKNDILMHYSSDSFFPYIQKIIWRVKNNIFFTKTVGASGFVGRERYDGFFGRFKKYMFLPYAFSIVFPGVDSLRLMYTRKDLYYAVHLPLTVLTACVIVYFSVLKALGVKPILKSYDGTTRAYEKK